MARSRSAQLAEARHRNRQRIAAHRQRLAATRTTQAQRSAARQRHQLAREANARRSREDRASSARRSARESAISAGIARKISAPFYARKLPDGGPRLWATKNNPVYVSQATASTISHYNIAVHEAARAGGDKTRIDEFFGRVIADLDGNTYELVTDAAEIRRLIEARHRIDYVKNYRAAAA